MASIVLTKTSGNPIFIPEIYKQMVTGDVVTVTRSYADITRMTTVMTEVNASRMTIAITPTADELGSGMLEGPQAVSATDIASASASSLGGQSPSISMRYAIATGNPAESVLIAANGWPRKMRILDAIFYISTNGGGGSTAVLRDQAAGAGQAIATFDTSANGRILSPTSTASTLITPGASIGLFLHRSVNTIVGEIVVTMRPEV